MASWHKQFENQLNELQKVDPAYRTFGSEYHHYKLKPTAPESLVLQVEEKFNCRLPNDYRNYVLGFSDGGAGPGVGLISLEKAVELTEFGCEFPFEKRVHFMDDLENNFNYDDIFNGSLLLAHHGCSMYSFLVVRATTNCPQVWHGGEDFIEPQFASFSQWVLQWVGTALTDIRKTRNTSGNV